MQPKASWVGLSRVNVRAVEATISSARACARRPCPRGKFQRRPIRAVPAPIGSMAASACYKHLCSRAFRKGGGDPVSLLALGIFARLRMLTNRPMAVNSHLARFGPMACDIDVGENSWTLTWTCASTSASTKGKIAFTSYAMAREPALRFGKCVLLPVYPSGKERGQLR